MESAGAPETKRGRAARLLDSIPYQAHNDSPTIKRYTNWRLFEERINGRPSLEDGRHIALDSDLYTDVIRLRGGGVIREKSSGTLEARAVPADSAEVFRMYEPEEGRLLARHISGVEEALVIRVGEGDVARAAIIADFPINGPRFYHVAVILEEASTAHLDFYAVGRQERGLISLTAEFELSRESRALSRAFASVRGEGLLSLMRRAALSEGAFISYGLIALGGNVRASDESVQSGRGARSRYSAFLLSGGKGHVEYITNSVNGSPLTHTEVSVRGLSFSGGLIHRGTVRATREAIGSVNRISSTLMPLGDGSLTVSVPCLEVDTDHVEEASHSSDISELDEETLFYIHSRGLNEREALHLLIRSYIDYALLRGANEPARDIDGLVEKELEYFLSDISL